MVCRWFANPKRYGWYVLIRIARAVGTPFFYLAAVILTKRTVIGKFQAGPRDFSQWGLLKHWLIAKLMPGGDLGKVTHPSGPARRHTVAWHEHHCLGAVFRQIGCPLCRPVSEVLGLHSLAIVLWNTQHNV